METHENGSGKDTRSGFWIEASMTLLAIIGLLTLVIGGSLLVQRVAGDDDEFERVERREVIREQERVERRQVREEPERVCFEERRGGGLFGDRRSNDGDFDAEAEFAGDRIVVVCEDW